MDLALLSELRYCKSARLLAARLEDLVINRVLSPGEILPSSREVAVFLQVSRSTVSRAFNMMEARGFFIAHQGQGTIVNSHSLDHPIDFSPSAPSRFDWNIGSIESERERLVGLHARLDRTSKYDNLMSHELLPLASWKSKFASAVMDPEIGIRLTRGDAPLGCLPLREAVSAMLQRSKGILYPPDRIAVYSSAESALQHVRELLVAPQDTIACDALISCAAFEALNSTGSSLVPVRVDKDGLVIDELRSIDSPGWLFLSNSGASLSKERCNRFYEWWRERTVAVVEVADYAESCAGASPVSTMLSLSAANSHILLYNVSQLLFPLNSFCCLILPPELVALFERTKHLFDARPLLLEDYVVAELMNDGTLEKHRYHAQKILKQRKQTLISQLVCGLANNVRITDSRSMFSISVRFDAQWTKSDVSKASLRANLPLHVQSKTRFAASCQSDEFSISLAALNEDELQKRVAAFARNLRFAKNAPYLLHDCSNLAV